MSDSFTVPESKTKPKTKKMAVISGKVSVLMSIPKPLENPTLLHETWLRFDSLLLLQLLPAFQERA